MPRRVNRGRFVRKGVEAGSEGATPTRALLPLSAWRQGAVSAQVASTNVSPIVEASHFRLEWLEGPYAQERPRARKVQKFNAVCSTMHPSRRRHRTQAQLYPGPLCQLRRTRLLLSLRRIAADLNADGTANAHVGGGGGARRCAPSCGTRAMPKFLFEAACTLDRFKGVQVREDQLA